MTLGEAWRVPRIKGGSIVKLQEVDIQAVEPHRLAQLIGAERLARFDEVASAARDALAGRIVLNVNSTAAGGGVAELLQGLLAYARGAGVDTRWVAINGDPRFFAITKRIHNRLYGGAGDGGDLGPAEHRVYEATLHANAPELQILLRPGDVAILHDPQTAGLAPVLSAAGLSVVWRCHVGVDVPNDHSRSAWSFLRRYIGHVGSFVFSRAEFAPHWVPEDRLIVIPPSIDPFCAKNEEMTRDQAVGVLQYAGLVDGGGQPPNVSFTRRDGTPGRINRHADILQTGPPPPPDAPLVVQASRWDVMKDMPGVMRSFAEYLGDLTGVHLVLAGPSVHGVADDPEAAHVLDGCIREWRALPHSTRSRVHLACIPMADADEAAAIVNALQRHATVVAQKSIAEGFGLTVAEAMWKERPVVAGAVGGIVNQIIDGETDYLVDPHDLEAFAGALRRVLSDPIEAARLGRNARQRVIDEFLADRHLAQWASVIGMALATDLEPARDPTVPTDQ